MNTCKNSTLVRIAFTVLALTGMVTQSSAKDINYSAGVVTSGSIAAGDRILVAIGANTTTYKYTYTGTTGTMVTGSQTIGTPVVLPAGSTASITTNSTLFTSPGGLTISSGDTTASVWAVVDGGIGIANARQLLVINEPITAGTPASNYILNLNGVMFQNGYAGTSNGGAWNLKPGNATATPPITVNGAVTFYNNMSGSTGGAVYAGSNGMIFNGTVIFDTNKAGVTDAAGLAFSTSSYGGGALVFRPTALLPGATSDNLEFTADSYFINNLASGQGGAIWSTNSVAVSGTSLPRNIIFHGLAVFEGNVAGISTAIAGTRGLGGLQTATQHGGAIYATTGMPITFYDSALFTKNISTGNGGAIYSRDSDVHFSDEAGRTYTGNRVYSFARNVSVYAATSNGGAIIVDNTAWATGNPVPTAAVIFDATNFTANFTGNANAGLGGAIRVNGGGIYMYNGAFSFVGNQVGGVNTTGNTFGSGGALAVSSAAGYLPAGRTARIELKTTATFDSNLAKLNGGAIWAGNISTTSGTAITNNSMYFSTDTPGSNIVFQNNTAGGQGGAIFTSDSIGTFTPSGSSLSNITMKANQGDIVFTNNRQGATVTGNIDATAALAIYNGVGTDTTGYMTATGGNANDIYFAMSGTGAMYLNLDASVGHKISFDGGFSGSNGLLLYVNKTGAGDLIFDRNAATALGANTNNVTTRTNVAAGSLLVKNGAIYGSGSGFITIASGANIGGYGTFKESSTVQGGASITIGDRNSTTPQILTFGTNLALGTAGQTSTIYYDLLSSTGAPGTYDQLIVNGTLTTAGTEVFDVNGLGTGTYTLVSSSNVINVGAATYTLQSNGAALTSRYTTTAPTLSADQKNILISASMSNLVMNWNGAPNSTNTWQDSSGTTWNNANDPLEHYFRNGDVANFSSANSGTVNVAANGVTAASMNVDVVAGSNYTFTGGTITTTNAAASTTLTSTNGKLTKTGAGTLTFTNTANLFTAGIDIASGTIAFTKGAQLNTGTTAITFTGDAALKALAANTGTATLASTIAVNSSKTATLDLTERALNLTGSLTGSGNITKTGANDLIFSGYGAAYTGTTAITAGKLAITTNANLGGAIILSASTILQGTGTASGKVTANNGSSIQAGDGSSPSTLTIGSLALDTTTLKFGLYAGTNAVTGYNNSDNINLLGASSYTGSNTIDVFGSAQNGTYLLGKNMAGLGGVYSGTTLVTLNGSDQIPGARQGGSLVTLGSDLYLQYVADISRIMTWTGSTSGNWNIADDDWTNGGTVKKFGNGDTVIFNDIGAARNTVNLAGTGQQFVSDIIFTGTTSYTFVGAGINANASNMVLGSTLTPTGKLSKAGSGTVTFNDTANYFEGGIDLSGGAIVFTSADQLQTSATAGIHFTGNSTLITGTDAITLNNTIAIDNAVTGTVNTQAYTLTLGGTLTGAGNLAKIGTGTLAYTGNATTYTGTTAVNAGTMILSTTQAFGGNIAVSGSATLAGSGTVLGAVTVASAGSLIVGQPDGTNPILNVANLTMLNSSTLTTNATTGTLAGNLTIGATAADKLTVNIALNNTLALSTTTTGAGGITKNGAGTLLINTESALGNTGTTTINTGTVTLANYVSPVTFTAPINLAGGWLNLASGTGAVSEATAARWNTLPSGITYTGTTGGITGINEMLTYGSGTVSYAIAGGIIVVVNPGSNNTTTLAGANTYTGITRIDSGTLNAIAADQLGSASNTLVFNGGNLHITATSGATGANTRKIELRAAATITVDGITNLTTGTTIETGGAWALTKDGNGSLTLAAPSTRTGITNLQAGSIILTATNALGSGTLALTGPTGILQFGSNNLTVTNAIALGSGGTLLVNTIGNSSTMSGAITGPGGLYKVGTVTNGTSTSILTLTGANTYSGTTTVNTGVLRAGTANTFSPNSDVYVISTASTSSPVLDFNGYNQSIGNLTTYVTSTVANSPYVMMRGASVTLANGNGTFTNGGIFILGSAIITGTGYYSIPNTNTAGATVTINGNYTAQYLASNGPASYVNYGHLPAVVVGMQLNSAGHLVNYDQLIVRGNVSGTTNVNFAMSGPSVTPAHAGGSNGSLLPTLIPSTQTLIDDMQGKAFILATGSMAPGSFVPAVYPFRVTDANGIDLLPVQDGTRVILGTNIAPELPGVLAIDAASYLVGKTALDSLSQRQGDLRLDNTNSTHGMDLWIHGLQTHDIIHNRPYAGSTANTTGAQMGIDYTGAQNDRRFTFGIFGDYMSSKLRQPNSTRTEGEVYGFGAYSTYQYKAFSLDGIFRASQNRFSIYVPGTPEFELTGNTISGALQLSYLLKAESKWNFELQLQGMAQRHNVNSGQDGLGRQYIVKTMDSLTGRTGILIYRSYETKSGITWIPHARISAVAESDGKGRVTVGTTNIKDSFAGIYGQFELGLVVRLSQYVDLMANGVLFTGSKVDSYSGNFGVRFSW